MSVLPPSFLAELASITSHTPEPNIFSLGARGYYENPTSDLLAFFLAPYKPHQLGATFLTGFFTAISSPHLRGSSIIKISREVSTKDNKRLDIVIRGRTVQNETLLVLIENKIEHEQNNPFESYEAYARDQAADITLQVVLSKDGSSPEGWIGLSYQQLIHHTSKELNNTPLDTPHNKWHHFALDFLAHLTAKTCTTSMTPEEINFVESNFQHLKKAQELANNYRSHLLDRLPTLIDDHSGKKGAFSKDDGWCIRVRHPLWQKAEIAWWNCPEENEHLKLTIYIEHPNDETKAYAADKFVQALGMEHGTEARERWHSWVSEETFTNREDAETRLKELADHLFTIFSGSLAATK